MGEPVLLVTGFGPFPGYPVNPSWEAARELDGARAARARVRAARLEVAWARAAAQLAAAIERERPAAVLCLGVAPGERLRLERWARNRDASAQPDADGVRRAAAPIRAGGPDRLPTRLPLDDLERALRAAGFEAEASEDAGGYLCNHAFYALLDAWPGPGPAGFVHVPPHGPVWPPARLAAAVRTLAEILGAALGDPQG